MEESWFCTARGACHKVYVSLSSSSLSSQNLSSNHEANTEPPDNDEQIHPAGRHVPQTSGEPSAGLPAWIGANPSESIDNTDVVLWHTFGLTHFPAPEDFPVMPAEPMTLLLRPRNFFTRNPCMDVAPSYSSKPSDAKKNLVKAVVDGVSTLAFGEGKKCANC